MQFPSRDLTNQYISTSYQDVVQRYNPASGSNVYLLDGYGYVIIALPTASIGYPILTTNDTASWAITASYAMNGTGGGGSSSYAQTASYALLAATATLAITYSTNVTHATIADYAYVADVAEMAETASIAYNATTASYALKTGLCDTSSYSLESIYALSADTSSWAIWAVHAINSDTASEADFANLAAHALTSDWSRYAETASVGLATSIVTATDDDIWLDVILNSSSYSGSATNSMLVVDADKDFLYNPGLSTFLVENITASVITASAGIFGTASYAVSASWAPGSNAVSASWASSSISSSFAETASYASNVPPTASWAVSSSFAESSTSSSWASASISTSYSRFSETASYAFTSSYELSFEESSSWASQSFSSSYAVSASRAETASYLVYPTSVINVTNGSTSSLLSFASNTYNSVFVNYILNDTVNYRAGSITVLCNTTSEALSEVSTTDLGNSDDIQFYTSRSGLIVDLVVINAGASTYSVKYHYDMM